MEADLSGCGSILTVFALLQTSVTAWQWATAPTRVEPALDSLFLLPCPTMAESLPQLCVSPQRRPGTEFLTKEPRNVPKDYYAVMCHPEINPKVILPGTLDQAW